MGKSHGRDQRATRKQKSGLTSFETPDDLPPQPRAKPKAPLTPKTEAQRRYIASISHNQITFGIGPAGVGKTYVAARIAARRLKAKEIEQIVLTRPVVEADERIGFLPGEPEEKLAPYIAAYGPGFRDEIGSGHFEYLCRTGAIEVVPLAFMQGRSWDRPSMVLFDEAENATPRQMKMFLTRLGDDCTAVIDGDPAQQFSHGKSGLIDGLAKLRYIKSVGIVEFTVQDVVRSGIVREILQAYDAAGPDLGDEGNQLELPGFITGRTAA